MSPFRHTVVLNGGQALCVFVVQLDAADGRVRNSERCVTQLRSYAYCGASDVLRIYNPCGRSDSTLGRLTEFCLAIFRCKQLLGLESTNGVGIPS
jgi:hypothetical protein